jgi:phosphoribosylanthranilate isomerase
MKVKICGITDIKTALAAVECGADAIGFVFAESKRKITEDMAKSIISQLPENILKVGVFVNESREEIERISSNVGLTHIQLHGDESEEFCALIKKPVIKAISISDKESLKKVKGFSCEYILVDGPKGKYRGGNGLTFDWTHLDAKQINDKKIILAGGLTIENVEEAIRLIQPYMVDVSSGVETEGKKDVKKIRAFLEKAKGSLLGGLQDGIIHITK